ncbi:MAG: SAM-dependent methyltransferase [Pseudomonadota bacterium]
MTDPADPETAVERLLKAQIASTGPLSVADFMALALAHPEHGYYATRDPLGAAGDFITAPEISQMFGEMIGLWLATVWQEAGGGPVRLIELGPGRGTLMADALRAAQTTGLPDAAEVWLVETSPALRAEQAKRVPHAQWAESLTAVPDGPMLLVANEFLDALPVRQFIASDRGWHERLLGLGPEGELAWGHSAPLPGEAGAGDWAEKSPAVEAVTDEIARRLSGSGGAALLIDYGYTRPRPPGPTLQAVRGHRKVDPLSRPGETDLTWLIDFTDLAGRFEGLRCAETAQGSFMASLGIGQRASRLAESDPGRANAIASELERLTDAAAMGTLFRVLGVASPDIPSLPGFPES